MKVSFLSLFIIFLSSCSNGSEQKLLEENKILEEKIDSLAALVPTGNDVGQKFVMLLNKETRTSSDSTLIPEYKNLLDKNDVLDLYIWDRIETILDLQNYKEIVSEFAGTYRLKPIFAEEHRKVNVIKIKNDSLLLFKNKDLIASDKLKIRNSSNSFTKGKILVNNFLLTLHSSGFGKLIFMKDNFCMDCEELEFVKVD